ncbi:MAG: hypothetical protein WA901_04740 [Phormidesmis sp.]
MVCLMAAVNVAVTKTPVSTSIILSVLSGTAMLPVIVIASFTSFILTGQIAMIGTQRSRSTEEERTQPWAQKGLLSGLQQVPS